MLLLFLTLCSLFSLSESQIGCLAGRCPNGQRGKAFGCTNCDAGTTCSDCCKGSLSSTCAACASGTYCGVGTGEISCPAGRYGGALGLKLASCSGPCSAGYYGSSPRQTSPFCNGPCSAGFFCAEGSTSPTATICPSGFIA